MKQVQRILDLAVIILTYNEELHIRRCLDNVKTFAREIYIIDSFSTDNTLEIASEYSSVSIMQHKWENSYAKQFNWGLANAPIKSSWILRLDADEFLTTELIMELDDKLDTLDYNITGLSFNLRRYFMGEWLKRGIYPIKLIRCFRNGKAKCEQRLMDEHIELFEGECAEFKNDFVDENLNNLSWFCQKHINYAIREAADLLDIEYNLTENYKKNNTLHINKQALQKRKLKYKYAKQPLFVRSFAYFIYRYIIKGAFLEGKTGFIWTFMQGWWYRTLVDVKIFEIKRKCKDDKEEIIRYLQEEYNVSLK